MFLCTFKTLTCPSVHQVNRTDQRYKGFKLFKMDPKFRVSIQPLWRPKAGSPLFLLFSKSHEMPMVKVLSQEAYNEKVELIQASAMTPKELSLIHI